MKKKEWIRYGILIAVLGIIVGITAFVFKSFTKPTEVAAIEDYSEYGEIISDEALNDDGGIEILDEGEFQVFVKEYDINITKSVADNSKTVISYYVVQEGDSLYKIAAKLKVNMNVLIANNPSVRGGKLKIGQQLKVLSGNSIEYEVVKGDSLVKIANKFGVKMSDLLDNNKLETTQLKLGQKLIVKNANPSSIKTEVKKIMGFKLHWPVKWAGATSPFGKRFHPVLGRTIFHKGVDLRAKFVPLFASEDGKVTRANWSSGYGKLIIIKHSDGYETRYAHLNKMNVRAGQWVKKGQLIGQTGKTGRITGPHLHFEVRKNEVPLNPMRFKR